MISDLMFWVFVFFFAIGVVFNKLAREFDDGIMMDLFELPSTARRIGWIMYDLYFVCWSLAFVALAACALASFMERI